MKIKTFFLISALAVTLMGTAQNVTTVAGSTQGFADGVGTAAKFDHPIGMATDPAGNIYVADCNNHRIRKITPSGAVSTLAGSTQGFADGVGAAAQFNFPQGVATDAWGNLYVADFGNNRIRKITPAGEVSTLAGSGVQGFADGTGATARFNLPSGVATDVSGNVYVADQFNHMIRKISPAGMVSTLAGSTRGLADGIGASARFDNPIGIATDASENVYVGEIVNCRIRKITPAGEVSTLAGSTRGFADGMGESARFYYPVGLAVDAAGNIYAADNNNNRIRKINPEGLVTTVAGSTPGFDDGIGASAQFSNPLGVATDALGNLYVANFADFGNHSIRKITQQLGVPQSDSPPRIKIYPNPVTTVLTLKLEDSAGIDKILITDISGKTVLTTSQNSIAVNVESLAAGLYFLEAYSGERRSVGRFAKN